MVARWTTADVRERRQTGSGLVVAVHPAAGISTLRLAHNDGGVRMGMPAWSPDGSQLAYSWASNDDLPTASIRVVNASLAGKAGAITQQLRTPSSTVSLVSSPDGSARLAWSEVLPRSDDLAIVPFDGSRMVPILGAPVR